MFTKYGIVALCAAASVSEVAAKPHRHQHQHPKKDVVYAETDVVVFTEYTTVTVYEGAAAGAAAETASPAAPSPSPPAVTPVVAPSPPEEPQPAPVAPTTLVPEVKPASPSVEAIAEVSTEAPAAPSPAPAPTTSIEVPAPVEPSTAYPTSSPEPSTTSVTPPPAPTPGGSKRGAAFNDATLVDTVVASGADISWCYNWGAWKPTLNSAIKWYPMMWGPQWEEGWFTNAQAAIDDGIDALLSFNEPDWPSQANLSPDAAAAAHQKYFGQFAGQVRVSSPAISSTANTDLMGISWLNAFFVSCGGKCQVDFCAAHWYGPGGENGAQAFLDHVKDVHEACDNKPVWITEFRADDSPENVKTFVDIVIPQLDSEVYGFVEKYSWFMLSVGNIMTSSTTVSTFAKAVVGVA